MSESTLLHRRFARARLDDRQINELIGISHGIIADDRISQEEALYLQKWLTSNLDVTQNPLTAILYSRIKEMLVDNRLDNEESIELLETLKQFTGQPETIDEAFLATTIPLSSPAPEVTFPNKNFCFTGTFAYGSRKDCENFILEKGGSRGNLTLKTNYLIIGTYVTDSWIHSSYGRKIEKAVKLRDDGVPISIISEQHWLTFH